MIIGYQDVELKIYDDEYQNAYNDVGGDNPSDYDELFGKRRRKKRRIVRKYRRSRRPRVIARRQRRDVKRIKKGKVPKYPQYRRPSYPVLRTPIKRKLPKSYGSPIKAPVKKISIRKIPITKSIVPNPGKPSSKVRSSNISMPKKGGIGNQIINEAMQAGMVTDQEGQKTLGGIEKRVSSLDAETPKPKQAGMGKGVILIIAIVGGLIIVTKVFGGKKTSEIVKVKKAV